MSTDRFEPRAPARSKVTSLADAIASNVRPGDAVHLGMTHARFSAAFFEVVRRFRGTDPRFTLLAVQMTTPLAPLVHERLAERIVTSWSGNSYWTPGPNEVYQRAWSGGIAFEHWSILSFAERLRAGARGLASTTTRSLRGSDMERNPGVRLLADGDVLIPALVPDVSLFHAPAADEAGNVLFCPPLFEDVSGALAARRGAIVTVERIVPTEVVRANAHLCRLPASHVVAVVEAPLGAHPGGVFPTGLDLVEPYGEDYEFWVQMREAAREPSSMDAWIAEWILPGHDAYVARLGADRVERLRARSRSDATFEVSDADAPATPVESAIVAAARVLAERIRARGLTTMLAGAGNANLAAWLAAYTLDEPIDLVAEMGLVGYWPRPGEPILFNQRNFPTCTMLSDIDTTLGVLVGGARARSIGALGAAEIDVRGSINSTEVPGERLLMGSGGANDVITRATETVVLASQSERRFRERVSYVTGPGDRVSAVVSQLGVFTKDQGELILSGLLPGSSVEECRARCGWDLRVAGTLDKIDPPSTDELLMLRAMDPQGWFRR
jgi:acyl CoA:acetate/3-ketoacid CoA transferase alpha subunit